MAWDPARLSWASFKNDVIGATDPSQANEGSIRKKLLDQWDPLGLPEQPNGTDNGVHASAGPLEALKERLLWCGFDLEKDPTGSRLVQLAVWDEIRHPAINELLENPDIDVAGFKGKGLRPAGEQGHARLARPGEQRRLQGGARRGLLRFLCLGAGLLSRTHRAL